MLLSACTGEIFLQKQNGNFLLQTLLALTMVFAFMPFLANKLASRDMSAKMYSAKTSIETLHDVARVYLRTNQDSENCGTTVYCDICTKNLVNTLLPYGLPTGFNTTTALGQDISLQIVKKTTACGDNTNKIEADIIVTRGNLSDYQLAELARMVGFFAHASDGNIYVSVPVDAIYSDLVSRRETDEHIGFLTELDMNWNRIENVGELHAESGNFYRARIDVLTLMGDGSSTNANIFGMLKGDKFRFNKQSSTDPALSVKTSSLNVDNAELQTVGLYGGYLQNLNVSVGGQIGKTGSAVGLGLLPTAYKTEYEEGSVKPLGCGNLFIGTSEHPVYLNIGNSFTANSATGVVSKIVVSKFLNVGENTYGTSSDGSGIHTLVLYAPKITFRDKKLAHLKEYPNDGVRAVMFPSGMSAFPDVDLIDCPGGNCLLNKLVIIEHPEETGNTGKIECNIALKQDLGLEDKFSTNNRSLLQNILCKYIYLERAERRINQVLYKKGKEFNVRQ